METPSAMKPRPTRVLKFTYPASITTVSATTRAAVISIPCAKNRDRPRDSTE